MSGKKKTEWVYDELLCFLGNPIFQIPVITFIEAHCLIFDPSIEDSEEYRKIHGKYKRVVQKLLDAFMQDSGLSHDEVIKALSDMNAKKDLREIFQGLFEQVLAMDDYKIFVGLMTQKNIELQQQALILIIQTTGSLPDSLQDGGGEPAPPPPARPSVPAASQDEDEVLRKVMERSKREFEEEQRHKKRMEEKDEDNVKTMLLVSKAEVSELEKQKKAGQEKLELAMSSLTTSEPLEQVNEGKKSRKMQPLPAQLPTVAPPAPKPVLIHQPVPEPAHQVSQTSLGPGLQAKPVMPGISSKEAAANWLKSAQDEASGGGAHSQAVQAAAAALSKLSPEELKKRQDYLREQRDKLVAMKKKEREQQLLEVEKKQPQRPASSRAARQTLQEGGGGDEKISPEEQKKLEMRRAIASKLKAELMGGQ